MFSEYDHMRKWTVFLAYGVVDDRLPSGKNGSSKAIVGDIGSNTHDRTHPGARPQAGTEKALGRE